MHRVSHEAKVDVPVGLAFRYVDTFDNLPKFLYGVKEFRAIGPSEPRLGTLLEFKMQLGPVKFTSGGKIAQHSEDECIIVQVNKGPISGNASWRFAAIDATATVMNVEVAYEISNGLTGRALARIIDSILGPAIAYTEKKLRAQLEEAYASS